MKINNRYAQYATGTLLLAFCFCGQFITVQENNKINNQQPPITIVTQTAHEKPENGHRFSLEILVFINL